ncbi:hypothetical protein SAMN06265795_11664 [Noviherbaspirillum humi]|uniref:Uncharacterized protein n=1 Tax=Noviherbaspirillum humi TaxID=1688639 RepID=A0A239KME4_9BURK|nr:hypothetical protein [Noviherbaspirillum humi]SNT18793.1 hypothetical protein SAMN06265795_11664 [Noviherbaspirillum humi]
MKLSTTDIKMLSSALDIERYRKTREKAHPDTPYNKLVDKFFANKPVTLPELNGACESEAACWAYVHSLLRIFPMHAAMALEGEWNGQAIANGMVLAHAVTRATVFLPLDAFVFVFATLLRHSRDGGISFAQVAKSAAQEKALDDNWYEIFSGWIGDVIVSRERTLDLAMHTAGVRFAAIGELLAAPADSLTPAGRDQACVALVKELLLGERRLASTPARRTRAVLTEQAARS